MAARTDRIPPPRTGNRVARPGDIAGTRLPYDAEAEAGTIGSVLLMPSLMSDVSLVVNAGDFHDDGCGEMFAAMEAMAAAGKPVDAMLLYSRLKQDGGLAILGDGDPERGSVRFRAIVNGVPTAAHARYYAEIVAEKAKLRRTIDACTLALQDAYDELPSEDVLGGLESRLTSHAGRQNSSASRIGQVFDRVIDSLERQARSGEPPAMLSGLPSADRIGLVFMPGEITILAARPGIGKTSLATQIAMHHAGKGRAVLFASLEMNDEALGSRVLFAAAGLNHQSVRTRGLNLADIDQLRQARSDAGDVPLYVWAPGRVRVGAIRAMAAAMKTRHDLRLLIVDYTSWIIADDPRAQMRDQVGEKIKALRGLGQRLGIPVLLLHQLNREGAGEKPQLTHLRDSGCVEEDADIVAFLHPVESQPPQAALIVAKSRQGAKGETPLLWHAAATRFSEFDERPIEDNQSYEPSFAEWNNP